MNRLERILRKLALTLGTCLIALPDMPRGKWLGFIKYVLTEGPSPEQAQGFFERFRERHWPTRPGVAHDVWAFVLLTTHSWRGFSLGLYIDRVLVFSAEVDGPDREHLRPRIQAALSDLPPAARQVQVGLSPYVS
ncbi:MAG: hypothetical protein E3J64_05380 [Anaerolineales bacterium]|nr:MAG: hypothetical protein E3J64_05380 [Anaerolineales bacterium]